MNTVVNMVKRNEIHLYLLALLPILSLAMVSIAIIIFSTISLLLYIVNKNTNYKTNKKNWIQFFLFSLLFFFYVVSLLWSDNLLIGLQIIEKSLSFLIIPLVIFILKPFKNRNQLVLFNRVFILSSVFLVILTTIYILNTVSNIFNGNNYSKITNLRDAIELTPLIGEHPIYFAFITAVGILLLYYNKFKTKILNHLCAVILIFGLMLASSKGVIIAVVIVTIIIIFQEIKNKINAILALIIFAIGVSALVYFSPLKSRIEKEIIENKFTYPEGIHYNSTNLRTAIYNCSFSLVQKSGLIGFAPADIQQELNECYKKFNTPAFKKTNYNTHNQYLDYLLSFGIIGLLLILFVFFYYLKIAIVNKDNLHLNFLILLYIVLFTENILSRNTGIVLFVTFNSLFGYFNLQSLRQKHDNS